MRRRCSFPLVAKGTTTEFSPVESGGKEGASDSADEPCTLDMPPQTVDLSIRLFNFGHIYPLLYHCITKWFKQTVGLIE